MWSDVPVVHSLESILPPMNANKNASDEPFLLTRLESSMHVFIQGLCIAAFIHYIMQKDLLCHNGCDTLTYIML
jgi:hypothetical protein